MDDLVFYNGKQWKMKFQYYYGDYEGVRLFDAEYLDDEKKSMEIGRNISHAEVYETVYYNELDYGWKEWKKNKENNFSTDKQFWLNYFSNKDYVDEYLLLYPEDFRESLTSENEEWILAQWNKFWKELCETPINDWFEKHAKELESENLTN